MTKKIQCLISAGPTREWIDPVRFISNPSSGKMGYALAEEAVARGFEVDLVSGPVSLSAPPGVRLHLVVTADEMEKTMRELFDRAHLVIMTAAVCDHRPRKQWSEKLSKEDFPKHLEWVKNNDIIRGLSAERKNGQKIIGFAAETTNTMAHAAEKLASKGLDWIAMNDVADKNIGFASDFNEVTLLSRSGESIPLGRKSKKEIAKGILDHVWP
jgi:phosphopantothenoylcysteine decarboxylase / phosphopantothenate---cysteine ligase